MTVSPDRSAGALILSLDFELYWGVRDHVAADGPYRANLLGARAAVPRMLDLFERRGIAATWATVGFLFARDRAELTDYFPRIRPRYRNPAFDPYREPLGRNERDDPLRFGRSLLDAVACAPRQEIASHTFSHYYCLEEGQDAEAFRADLDAARRIARDTKGVELRSLVLPRNQHNPAYGAVIRDAGFICFRGNQPGRFHSAADSASARTVAARAGRLADSYCPLFPHALQSWDDLASETPALADVRASRFLAPYRPLLAPADPLRAARIRDAMRRAAREGKLFHLWQHPHNWGAAVEESVRFLDGLFAEANRLQDQYGFQSLTMAEAAAASAAGPPAAEAVPA